MLQHAGLRGNNRAAALQGRSAFIRTRKKGCLHCDSHLFLKKKFAKNIFTPVLRFSVKKVNYYADEFHSFIIET